jgi:FKBP-type peptidyl-prolyl cis-trans isomerase
MTRATTTDLRIRLHGLSLLGLGLLAAHVAAQERIVLKTQQEKASYSLGVDLARNFKRQGVEVELNLLTKGFEDGLSGEKLLIPERDVKQAIITVQTEVRRRQALHRGKTPAQINKRIGEDFLAENKTKEGMVVLPNGLQYKVLKAGTGPKPTEADTVECYYRATLLDGTEFICTNPGQPATIKVKEADFAAWRQALQLMPVGSKWKLFVPYQLAYGDRGVGGDVGPNEAIILDLELLTIK